MNVSILILFASSAAALTAIASQQYSITDLGTLRPDGQGEAVATAINNSGIIVGYAAVPSGSHHGFLRRPDGTKVDLGALNSADFYSEGYAVNEVGGVAGVSDTRRTGFNSPFRYVGNGPSVELPRLESAGDAYGFGINSAGVVVGWSNQGAGCGYPYCQQNPGFATRWQGTTIQRIGGLGGYYSAATGINDAGFICGYSAVFGSSDTHAFVIAPDSVLPMDLGTLGGQNSQATAINQLGHIVGWAQTGISTNAHAAIWLPTGAEDLGALPDRPIGIAQGLNNSSTVVGYCATAFGDRHATIFRRGASPIDLNALIPTNSGWVLSRAIAVNDSGMIVGEGFRDSVDYIQRAFLLTPAGDCPLPVITSSGAEVQICWASELNRLYQLETCPEFSENVWSPEGEPIVGTGGTLCVTQRASPGQAERFYRVRCDRSAPQN